MLPPSTQAAKSQFKMAAFAVFKPSESPLVLCGEKKKQTHIKLILSYRSIQLYSHLLVWDLNMYFVLGTDVKGKIFLIVNFCEDSIIWSLQLELECGNKS